MKHDGAIEAWVCYFMLYILSLLLKIFCKYASGFSCRNFAANSLITYSCIEPTLRKLNAELANGRLAMFVAEQHFRVEFCQEASM